MIYKLIDSQQAVLEESAQRLLRQCLLMGKYLHAVTDDNRQILIDIHSVVGYCHYAGHPGVMTVSDYKEHRCCKKQCEQFQPYMKFPYWKKHKEELLCFCDDPKLREAVEQERQIKAQKAQQEALKRRQALEKAEQQAKERQQKEAFARKLSYYIEQLFGETSTYEMSVAKIECISNNSYRVYLVSEYDEYYDMSFLDYIIPALKKAYPGKYAFQRMRSPYGKFATRYEWIHRKKLR